MPVRCCIRLNEERPCSSSTTTSPSRTAFCVLINFGNSRNSGYRGVRSFWFRETRRTVPCSMNDTARYPSHLISNSQLGSSNGFSTTEASIGRMAEGMGRLVAPSKSLKAEDAEIAKELDPFFAATLFGFRLPLCSSVSAVVLFFALFTFFLSSLAKLSASHAAFTLPREAFLLLVHLAESSSPAICAIVLLLRTEVSYLSMSKPFVSYSSCFLIINHSLPLLPGLRAFMWTSAKSPFSRFPCSRNFRSPFLSIAAASASVPGTYFPSMVSGESGSHVPTSQTITVPAP